jgi:hypothetical protein
MIGGYIGKPIGGVVVTNAAAAFSLAADAGSYAITGTAATLTHKWVLAAGAGSYALTGTAATITHAWRIAAGAGSYALTGTAASLLHAWRLSAGAGSYALTGTAASLLHSWKLAAGAGSYVMTGTDAGLVKFTPGAFSLAADSGTYLITGTDAQFIKAFPTALLVIDTDTYSQHPVNCYLEGLPQFRHLENIVERQSGNKIPDKVILSTPGRRQLSKNKPSFTTRTTKGVLFD